MTAKSKSAPAEEPNDPAVPAAIDPATLPADDLTPAPEAMPAHAAIDFNDPVSPGHEVVARNLAKGA